MVGLVAQVLALTRLTSWLTKGGREAGQRGGARDRGRGQERRTKIDLNAVAAAVRIFAP